MDKIVQILGSLLILVPFALAQLGRLDTRSIPYLVLNLAGSGVLAVEAAVHGQWGFLLLEAVWAMVSLGGLVSAVGGNRRRSVPIAAAPTETTSI
jgi:hypothetical protein